MTIVVSDLVAKVRAEGVQETATAVRAVGQEAAQTARALEIMAGQFAKLHGGTAAEALSMFQRTGAQPTATAMAEAARAAERTTVAVQASVPHVQAAARAAADVHDGFKLSESSAVRFGAGLLGIGLGLNLAAGAASLLHNAIGSLVEGQLTWERSLREVHGLYGSLAPQILATAQAQASLPGTLGTTQEFVQAALNARYLSSRFGQSQGSITELTTAAGRVADFQGLVDPAARAANQARFLQFAESGGSGLRDIGLEGDPQSIAKRLGYSSGAALQGLLPQQVIEAQKLAATEQANRLAATATGDTGLLARRTQAEKAVEEFQTRIQRGAQISTVEPIGPELAGFFPQNPPAGVQTYAQVYEAEGNRLREALKAITDELGNASTGAAKAAEDLRRLGLEAGGSTVRLLTFTGSLERSGTIARGDIAAQAQGSVAGRARSANPLALMTDTEIATQASNRAYQEAYQNYVAVQAQNALAQSNPLKDFLPGIPGAQEDAERRNRGYTVAGQANRAGDMAGRSGTEAQAQLSALDLQSEERRLGVAEQLAGYRREALGYEAQMAPLLSQQAMLQDRMVVAARDNLDSRRALIQAEQAAQGPASALAERTYEQQRLELRAQISRASVRRGEGPTEDIAGLRRQYRETELHPELDLTALDSQHAVDVIQRQRAGEGLGRDLTLTNLEGEQRALDNQLIPLAQAARLVQDKEAAVSRTLALLDLEDTKQRTAAQLRANEAAQLGLTTQAIARMAEDYAAGLNLGATAAERSQVALEKARDAIKETIPLLHTLTSDDTGGRIANGLGAGGLGPTRGGGFTIIISPTAQIPEQVKTEVHIQVENALNQFFAGTATTGQPAPATVGGAGR